MGNPAQALFTDPDTSASPASAGRRSGYVARRRTPGLGSRNVTSLELSWEERETLDRLAAAPGASKSAVLRRGLSIVAQTDEQLDALTVELGLSPAEVVHLALEKLAADRTEDAIDQP